MLINSPQSYLNIAFILEVTCIIYPRYILKAETIYLGFIIKNVREQCLRGTGQGLVLVLRYNRQE